MGEVLVGQDAVAKLLSVLDLEEIDQGLFRGPRAEVGLQRVFGGQVAGQALVAAGRTVPAERRVHSLHGYFVRPGDSKKPIVYQVENIRDGRSFSVRRTVALQGGQTIFFMSASFHTGEAGLEHADPAPNGLPAPEEIPPLSEQLKAHPDRLGIWARVPRPIDVRYAGGGSGFSASGERPAQEHQRVWMKADGALPDDPLIHVCVLTYASDLTLLDSVLSRHGEVWGPGGYLGTSLDHALWFHRPFRFDDWILYDSVSPTAADGRGLAQGRFFDASGAHLASATQEGLLRRTPEPPGVP
ncbi:acyl-CoA thioesterase II [Glycomyces sp. TRM65418]|uniref:acyl-CoA thioesterase n=1 Tax=Glycomyces sp. TRM65418 TaxID=2867006 RepID=UPI001CE7083E|nr:acyl-CoA thioesterase II [Glycomyces sp. TRM65418]MCC3761659.1 acyl-CoA thioesterase II [Glycomyces sp. TRM65418]QZD55753.1 acyl-CoA thioesterase II [Glycomyces sp. TRM65418]